jgi:hypothetical protein
LRFTALQPLPPDIVPKSAASLGFRVGTLAGFCQEWPPRSGNPASTLFFNLNSLAIQLLIA